MPEPLEDDRERGSWRITALLSALIVIVAGGLAILTFFTEPTARKGGATKKTAMLVDVVEAERGTYRPEIVAQGTVEPARDVVLRPQVGGRVVEVAPSFEPGGFVEEGDLLVRLESADYRNALAQQKSELSQAKRELAVEKGRHDAAKAEYERFGEDLSSENESLVLREPQLEAAEDRVDAARAAVEQARLNLGRTTIEAPFDAHIVRRDVNVGSQVSDRDSLARLVGTDRYWIGIELPLSNLRWIATGEEGEQGSKVAVRNPTAWPEGAERRGRLSRNVQVLDDRTRMARVLATIEDPLSRESGSGEAPALVIGEYVEVTIEGEPIEDAVRIDRGYLRADETVWVMSERRLQIREVEVAVQDPKWAYVTEGLEGGEQIVTTNLSTIVEGAPLRRNGAGKDETGE